MLVSLSLRNSEEMASQTNVVAQCEFFVVRKKRLCRMTVRTGRRYCGEHEPQEGGGVEDGVEAGFRVPCPYDPKHTCYASKLESHLGICNARPRPLPPYIQLDVNAPAPAAPAGVVRTALAAVPGTLLMQVIRKINYLYETHVAAGLAPAAGRGVHAAVRAAFSEERGEGTRRHLRQASALLHLAESEGLVRDGTCYVELGAGRGQLSYYVSSAWCGAGSGSGAVLVDRASPRHKLDNRLGPGGAERVRADLRHLALHRVPAVTARAHTVGLAKHLCGVATDYALRCLAAEGWGERSRGLVLATCCHHRCEAGHYVGATYLEDMGITEEELNVMLGVVSWATCGDGRPRPAGDGIGRSEPQKQIALQPPLEGHVLNNDADNVEQSEFEKSARSSSEDCEPAGPEHRDERPGRDEPEDVKVAVSRHEREAAGRRAKALLDWGRVLYLRGRGFEARLCHYVPPAVSLENVCILASTIVCRDHGREKLWS